MSFPSFFFVDAFKLPALHVSHTKSTWSTAQSIILETSFVYCSPNSATPYTFKHLKMTSKMTTLILSVNFLKGWTNASKPGGIDFKLKKVLLPP